MPGIEYRPYLGCLKLRIDPLGKDSACERLMMALAGPRGDESTGFPGRRGSDWERLATDTVCPDCSQTFEAPLDRAGTPGRRNRPQMRILRDSGRPLAKQGVTPLPRHPPRAFTARGGRAPPLPPWEPSGAAPKPHKSTKFHWSGAEAEHREISLAGPKNVRGSSYSRRPQPSNRRNKDNSWCTRSRRNQGRGPYSPRTQEAR
jgi:hypothetical protein